jgi:hypothetical protein
MNLKGLEEQIQRARKFYDGQEIKKVYLGENHKDTAYGSGPDHHVFLLSEGTRDGVFLFMDFEPKGDKK